MPTQLEHKDIKALRLEILEEQDGICPLCGTPIDIEDAVLDHDHSTTLIRGVLHSCCNSIEGNLKHKFKRGGGEKYTDFLSYIKNLCVYLEKEQYPLIHPIEKPKEPKLMKSSYNELIRTLKKNKYKYKIPPYPKSKKITKPLLRLYEQFNITPKFYKGK